MKKVNPEIKNFIEYVSDKVEQFAKNNPDFKSFVTISVSDENLGGFATAICGSKATAKEQLKILKGISDSIVDYEVKKFINNL